MSAITRLCKRALLLSHGEIVKDGPAYEVVNEYLYMGHIKPCREWSLSYESPGDDVVRMRAVRIKTDLGLVVEGFDISKPIAVEMEFDILKSGHMPVVQFSFHNEEDSMIFMVNDRDPKWYRRQRPAGRYVSTAWVPGNLLSEGIITVGAGIMTEDPFRLHCDVPRVVGFRVHESAGGNTARGDFTGRWPGAVRPLLKWTTQHTPFQSETDL
jgi:lipopolysaccharide transport system ATP-binding protein